MSTILKALRRLEEDSPTTDTAADFTNPADPLAGTGPLVADELRDRILAEEHAAEAGAVAQRNPDTKRRIAIGAAAVALMLVLGFGIYSSMSDEAVAPTEPEKIALATALPPTPSPAPPTARARAAAPIDDPAAVAAEAAVAKSVSMHPTVSQSTASPPAEAPAVVPILPVTIPESAVASVAASPKPALDSPTATSKPGARKTLARSVAAKPSSPPKAAEPLAIAAVTPSKAARAVDSQRAITTSEASRSKPATPRSRPKPTNLERRTPSVSAALPKRVPEERPGTSRPSTSPSPRQSEFAFRPHFPDLAVVGTAWHPDAARRSAKIRLEATKEVLTLREGDAVGGLVVQEISPSAVVFKAGDVEIRRRVGRAGSSD